MIEKNLLKYDRFDSTYGWRILVSPEYDYRMKQDGPFIMEGYSKYQQVPEMKNKDQLFLLCMAGLFEKRWVYKCQQIVVYKATQGPLFLPLATNDKLLSIRKDGEIASWGCNRILLTDYCFDMFTRMIDNYNRGMQHGVGLRVVQ